MLQTFGSIVINDMIMWQTFGSKVINDIYAKIKSIRGILENETNTNISLIENITPNQIEDYLEDIYTPLEEEQSSYPKDYINLVKIYFGCSFTLSVAILYTLYNIFIYYGFGVDSKTSFSIFVFVTSMTIVIGEVSKSLMYYLDFIIYQDALLKPERAFVVSLTISIGFAFGESLSIISIIWFAGKSNLDIADVNFHLMIAVTLIKGNLFHILCGNLIGIMNAQDEHNNFKSCIYIIPARVLYTFGDCKLILNFYLNLSVTAYNVQIGLVFIAEICSAMFVCYLIDFFSNSNLVINEDQNEMLLLDNFELQLRREKIESLKKQSAHTNSVSIP